MVFAVLSRGALLGCHLGPDFLAKRGNWYGEGIWFLVWFSGDDFLLELMSG